MKSIKSLQHPYIRFKKKIDTDAQWLTRNIAALEECTCNQLKKFPIFSKFVIKLKLKLIIIDDDDYYYEEEEDEDEEDKNDERVIIYNENNINVPLPQEKNEEKQEEEEDIEEDKHQGYDKEFENLDELLKKCWICYSSKHLVHECPHNKKINLYEYVHSIKIKINSLNNEDRKVFYAEPISGPEQRKKWRMII